MSYFIRIAEEKDAASILDIYSPFIKNTSFTFEYDVPALIEFSSRITKYMSLYPWLVCEYDGSVIAYAYAGKHRDRPAYQWSVESSVYVNENFHRKGIARKLYDVLFKLLKQQGILNVYAGITQPNPKSVNFHHTCGFSDIGIYKNVGYKLGTWHDVMWMHLSLGTYPSHPVNPVLFHEFRNTERCKDILGKANEGF